MMLHTGDQTLGVVNGMSDIPVFADDAVVSLMLYC